MTAIEILRNEHGIILEALELLERHARQVEAGGELDPDFARWILQFLQEFADHTHYAKVEGVLFRLLDKHGRPRGSGALADMLAAYESSRVIAKELEQARGRKDMAGFAAAGLRLADLLRQHLRRENETVLVTAEAALTPAEDSATLEAFGRVVHERDGVLIRQRHLAAIERWRERFGVVSAPGP